MPQHNMTISDHAEYEQLFPYEQEYRLWIDALEADYRQECERRLAITVPNKARFPNLTKSDNYSIIDN